MREVKFRGKVDGVWQYFVASDSNEGEWSQFWGLVERKTVGQWTGLQDSQGKDIYEGDILSMEGATAKVVFWERPPEFGLDYAHNEALWCEDWNVTGDSDRMTIIGNIYEHPELLLR